MRWQALAVVVAISGCPAGAQAVSGRADLHAHVTMHNALAPMFVGSAESGTLAAAAWHPVNQIDAAGLRASGVRLVVATVWPPFALRGRTVQGEALHQLHALRDWARGHPDFAVVKSAEDARKAIARGRIALIPAVEGVGGVERVDDVDALYAAGARSITLVHFADTSLGDAAAGQLGPMSFLLGVSGRNERGLTALGRAAVERMFALGIVVDLAHASERTANEVLDLAERRRAPVIFSHASSTPGSPSDLGDAVARRIVKGDGLIGIGLFRIPWRPVPQDRRWPGFTDHTCDEFVAHWVYYADVVGPEAVMLGSDFNSITLRGEPGGLCPRGIRHVGDLPGLYAALDARGVAPESLDGSAERALKLFERAAAGVDPELVKRARRARATGDTPFDLPL